MYIILYVLFSLHIMITIHESNTISSYIKGVNPKKPSLNKNQGNKNDIH